MLRFIVIACSIAVLVDAGFEGIHETCEPLPIPFSKQSWIKRYGIAVSSSEGEFKERGFTSALVYDSATTKKQPNSFTKVFARLLMKQTGIIDAFRMGTNRIKMYNFIHGDEAVVHFIHPVTGEYTRTALGFHTKELFLAVPPGIWAAVEVIPHHFQDYIILVADYVDTAPNELIWADRENMLQDFPQHRDLIIKFTKIN